MQVTPLDHDALHECCDKCMEKLVTRVAGLIGASYEPRKEAPLTGETLPFAFGSPSLTALQYFRCLCQRCCVPPCH